MVQDFSSLEEMAPRFGVDVDVFIKAWLDEKLPLYIDFGNESPPCTIRRCISAQRHEYTRDDILYGRDLYQSKDSPDHCTATVYLFTDKNFKAGTQGDAGWHGGFSSWITIR